MTSDTVSTKRSALTNMTTRRDFDQLPLVLQPIISKRHPTHPELRRSHAMTIVLYNQSSADNTGKSQMDMCCPGIPSIGNQLRQRDLWNACQLPQLPYQVVILEQGRLKRLISHDSALP